MLSFTDTLNVLGIAEALEHWGIAHFTLNNRDFGGFPTSHANPAF
jgi:hypothetical protein